MSIPQFCTESNVWLARLADYLKNERYSRGGQQYLSASKRFCDFMQREGLTVYTVQPTHIKKHLSALKRQRRSCGRLRLSQSWRTGHRTGIHMLLRLVHGCWPTFKLPSSEHEYFHRQLIQEYNTWMSDLRGLSSRTCFTRCADAKRFLEWLGERGAEDHLHKLAVPDLDAFIQWRVQPMRRSSKKSVTVHLRSFLRHLHGSGRVRDLASAVIGPKLYAFEDIPSALPAGEVEKILQCARQDRSPMGLRDYAILVLLSTYGLRAGEITALRLEDIDWSHDRLRIHHSKTGVRSELPLLPLPGEALLEYLRKARPKTDRREVFLRTRAPYRAFRDGSSLYMVVGLRLTAAGICREIKKGCHAFRHAKAAELLRSAVPLKVIGDVLAHRSTRSTMTYLKLDVAQLREVALEIPSVQP